MKKGLTIILLLSCWIMSIAQISMYTEKEIQDQKAFIEVLQLKNQAKFEDALKAINLIIAREGANATLHFEKSRILVLLEDLDNAIRSGEKALELDNKNVWIAEHLAALFMDKEAFAKAANTYDIISQQQPLEKEPAFKAAYCYLRADEQAKALNTLNRLEENIGVDEEITQKKFDVYMGMGKSKRAEAEILKIIDKDPENAKLWYNLGAFYMQQGNQKKARTAFERVLEIDPEHKGAKLAFKMDESKAGPDVAYLRSIRGLIANRAISLDQKIMELIPYVEKNIDLEDEMLDATLLELVEMIEKIHPAEAKIYALKGDILFNKGEVNEARENYLRSLELDRSVYAVWAQVLHSCMILKDFPKLEAYASQAIDFFPNQALSYYYLGKVKMIRMEFADAENILSESVLIAGRTNPLRFDIIAELTRAQIFQNKLESAHRNIDPLMNEPIFQEHPILLEVAGDLSYKEGDVENALKFWRSSLKQGNPDSFLPKKIESKKLIE